MIDHVVDFRDGVGRLRFAVGLYGSYFASLHKQLCLGIDKDSLLLHLRQKVLVKHFRIEFLITGLKRPQATGVSELDCLNEHLQVECFVFFTGVWGDRKVATIILVDLFDNYTRRVLDLHEVVLDVF